MCWVYLFIAGLFEIGFTTALKLSDGFSKLIPSLLFLVCACFSFWLLLKAIQGIPLGTAYAVWTGIGAFGTVVVGIMFFGESASITRILLLSALVLSIIGLKLTAIFE